MRDSAKFSRDLDWLTVLVWLGLLIAVVLFWTGVASIAVAVT